MGSAALRCVESSWPRDQTYVPYIGPGSLPLGHQGSPNPAFKKFSFFWAQADMLDQEAAFVQIQERRRW